MIKKMKAREYISQMEAACKDLYIRKREPMCQANYVSKPKKYT